MKLIRTATVATLLLAITTAIGLPRTDGNPTHWHGAGWLICWQVIKYPDECSVQASMRGELLLDWYWHC